MRIIVIDFISLDGVVQAPGGQREDTEGGFEHGGWAAPYSDETMGREMAKGMGSTSLLLGRRTYEQFYDFWPKQTGGNPFTDVLNNTRKYVASRTLNEPLPWQNSTLLDGDAGDSVAALKAEPGDDLGFDDEFMARLESDPAAAGVLFIDPIASFIGTDTSALLAADGVYPNPRGAQKIGSALVDSLTTHGGAAS